MICRTLLVDDERSVLAALRRELMRKPDIGHDGLEIEMFTSPTQALARATEHSDLFELVIADHRMPGMDGIEFLERFKKLQPAAVRVLLTGEADCDIAIAAINQASVDTLIFKPWQEHDLKARVALALRQRALVQAGRKAIPPVHTGSYQLMLVDDEELILKALEREINFGGLATGGKNPLFVISRHNSAEDALASLADGSPDVVIADYGLPGMNGIEFLRHLREICPGAVRILLSGRPSVELLGEAINTAGVFHFLGKPWSTAELRTVLAQALMYHDASAKPKMRIDDHRSL